MDRAHAKLQIAEIRKLPFSPRVVRLCRDRVVHGENSPESLAELVVADPALTAEVLSVAYRSGVPTHHTLRSAIEGLDESSLLQIFSAEAESQSRAAQYDNRLEYLRRYSAATAAAAECISHRIPAFDPDEAQLLGLLPNIGKWVLFKLDTDRFASCAAQDVADATGVLDAETQAYGFHHGEAGKWFAENRRFPQPLVDAIWLHHVPPTALAPSCFPARSIAIITLAGDIANRICGTAHGQESTGANAELLAYLDLDQGCLPAIHRDATVVFQKRERDLTETATAPEGDGEPDTENRQPIRGDSVDTLILRRRLARFEVLHRLLIADLSDLPFHSVVLQCAEAIRDGLGIAPGMCYAADASAREILGATWKSLAGPIARFNADLHDTTEEGIAGAAPVLRAVRDLGMGKISAAWQSGPGESPIRRDGLLVMPLLHRGRSLGQIVVDAGAAQFGSTDADIADLMSYARAMGAVIAGHYARDVAAQRCEALARGLKQGSALDVAKESTDLGGTAIRSELGQFAGGVARSLDASLGLISSQAQRMLAKTKDIETHRALDSIVRETRRLNRFRTDLAALAPHPKPRLEPALVNFCLQQFVGAIKPRLQRRGIRLEECYAENLYRVFLDSRRMEHVFQNIVTLAETAMDETGGQLTIQTAASPDRRAVLIQFTHDGAGVSATPSGDVFEPFNERTATDVGLTLAVCRTVLAEHGGRITIDRGPRGGDVLTIVLPAIIPEGATTTAEADFLETSAALQTVLIVDDDEAVRTILKQALHMRGYKVITAEDGEQALDIITNQTLDAIILDLLMPNRDGLTVLRDLHAMHDAPPVVFMTGNASPQVREEALALGADHFLVKPFELRRLLSVLNSLFGVPAASHGNILSP